MWRIRSNRKSLVENRTMRMGGWLLVLAIFGAGAVLSPPVFAADKQLTFMSGGAKGFLVPLPDRDERVYAEK